MQPILHTSTVLANAPHENPSIGKKIEHDSDEK